MLNVGLSSQIKELSPCKVRCGMGIHAPIVELVQGIIFPW